MLKDSSDGSVTQAEKEEVDSRSIYVGNVRIFDIELPFCFSCIKYRQLFFFFSWDYFLASLIQAT